MSLIWSKADSCGVASRGTAVVEKVIKWFQLEISQCYKPFDQRLIPKWIQLNQWIPPTIELSFICLVCFQGQWLSLAVWFLGRCRRRPCVMNICLSWCSALSVWRSCSQRKEKSFHNRSLLWLSILDSIQAHKLLNLFKCWITKMFLLLVSLWQKSKLLWYQADSFWNIQSVEISAK